MDLQRVIECTQGLVSGCEDARCGRRKLTALVHKASLERLYPNSTGTLSSCTINSFKYLIASVTGSHFWLWRQPLHNMLPSVSITWPLKLLAASFSSTSLHISNGLHSIVVECTRKSSTPLSPFITFAEAIMRRKIQEIWKMLCKDASRQSHEFCAGVLPCCHLDDRLCDKLHTEH